MIRIPVSVMVFTLNEEVNLPGCLRSLTPFGEVIVVDSFSTDRTKEISLAAGARFFEHGFTGFGDQRNWALEETKPRFEWILILDADERVPEDLSKEISAQIQSAPPEVAAYRLTRKFFMWGKWLKYSSLYPTWVVRLIRRDRVRYLNRGHAETQVAQGRVADLKTSLIDENLKGEDDWIERQKRYSVKEAEYELSMKESPIKLINLFSTDALERRAATKRLAASLPFRPLFYFIYVFFLKGGFLDGREGLRFCRMKASYHRMIEDNKKIMSRKSDK